MIMEYLYYKGMKIVLNMFVQEREKQFKFPKSKKKRIRKKFMKNKSNYKPEIKFFHDTVSNNIIVGELGFKIIKESLK